MSSSSNNNTLRQKNAMEMASFRSAFLADDTLVTIVPDFNHDSKIPLLSGGGVGPLKAGIQTKVPLWFAMLLQQRSLCSLQVPQWLQTDHLTAVKQHEISESSLTPATTTTNSGKHSTQDDDSHDNISLPFHYAELGQRFTSAKTLSDPTCAQASKAAGVVLQDIGQVRLDKLRQQFQLLSKQEMQNPNLCVAVPGIASAELAQLKPLILRALNDQRFLVTGKVEDEKRKDQQEKENQNAGSSAAAAAAASRRKKASMAAARDDDESEDEAPTTTTKNTNALRSSSSRGIRRFRG